MTPLIGTPYVFGCKNPESECGGIDCSGFVEYSYSKAGFKSVSGKNAEQQFKATSPTNYPFYADLLFFKGTYDKNEDCNINESDGITHVGIAFRNGWMVAAQGGKVDIYHKDRMDSLPEKKASSVKCEEGITPPDITKKCARIKGCRYTYVPTGDTFKSFLEYRYAPEFDSTVCK